MKLKQKLQAQIILLFVVVIFFGGLTLFYFRLISKSNEVILNENYATLEYVNEMRSVLADNDVPLSAAAIEKFQAALRREQKNITEKGETEVVNKLSHRFEVLRNNTFGIEKQHSAVADAQKYLWQIERINLDAVKQKSQNARQTIKDATIYLGGAAVITFLILFSFVFNLASSFEESLRSIGK